MDNWKNNTLNYYNTNATSFASSTRSVDFTQTQDRFLRLLPSAAAILDFGCGSGRDTKYFWMRECKSMRRMDRKSCAG